MNIQHQDGDTEGKFYLERDSSVKAELTYTREGKDTLIIEHTEVAPELRGGDIARELVDRAVAFARTEKLKVVPVCPYVKKVMQRDESMQDVLK